MNKADGKIGPMVLSKTDQHIIKSLTTLKFMGLFIGLSGVLGMLIGIYSFIYRPMTSSESILTRALTSAAIGFIGIGWYFYNMTRLVLKLKKHLNAKPEMQ